MERIVQFKRKTNTHVFIAFIGSKVVVAVPMSHEMFEPEMYNSLVYFKIIQEYYEDLSFAIDIINDLDLNTRIWSKE